MFDESGKWISTGCHTTHDATLWVEARLRNKDGLIRNAEHLHYTLTHRKGRNIQVMFKGTNKWVSSGYDDEINATLWAENELRKRLKDEITLEDFSEGFYTRTDEKSYRAKCIRKGRNYQDEYYTAMDGRLKNYVLPKFGNVYLKNITHFDVDDWFVVLTSATTGKKLSSDTKNKVLICLSNILDDAVSKGLLDENPCTKILKVASDSIPRLPIYTDELKILFPENDKQLEWVWDGLMWAVYFSIMRCTGFRPGEIAGLTRENYRPQYNGLFTTQSVNSTRRTMVNRIKTSGTGKGYKFGYLSDQCVRLLDKYIATLPEDQQHLFLVNGDFLTTYTSNKHFCTRVEKMGIELGGRTQYSLRHSFQTALAGELEKSQIEELMGHTKYRMDYDHRSADRMLRQNQDLRSKIFKII